MNKTGFTVGLISGAVVGSMVTAVLDPMKDKQSKAMKKTAGKAFRTLGSVIDTIIEGN